MERPENPNKDRVRRERNKLLARIDHLSNHGPKHLNTEQRLLAALFVREQYEALIRPAGSLRLAEIEEKLARLGNSLSGIRIHRWMLRISGRDITEELISHYANRPEPLRKTKTYFELADALARIGGDDPIEAKIALLRRTSLDTIPLAVEGEDSETHFDPSVGLLRLVRNFASDTAYRLDLANIYDQVERLQAAWSHSAANRIFPMRDAFERYTRHSLFSGMWSMNEIPALPSVRLAEIPLAYFSDAEVILAEDDRERHAVGNLRATWSLRLCIAPTAKNSVTPAMIRTTRLWLEEFPGPDVIPLERQEIIHPHGDGLDDLVPGNRQRAFLADNSNVTITFTEETSQRYLHLRDKDEMYKRTTPDETLPHEDLACAVIEPLDIARLSTWFRDGAGREDYEIERASFLNHDCTGSAGKTVHWFPTPCLAHDLENSIRNGRLRTEFSQSAKAMQRSLTALEKSCLSEAKLADRDLNDTWAAERVSLDRSGEPE
ncbi:hypothetical protein RV134_260013 [Roseovarius sp. EC-HK134]|uniref:hypothetical protein n=1 Tax=unclassified Roseovarius TaxID=2614913 RepID=UPI00125228E0|nr:MULTISPECIES: hypothetical protein [unclassified Roseovarius]VVT08349.1 hypothetical protein RV134_260013 [Roseovarius sp. EC-HK134]VVT08541.1 hypothetical protein RV420_290238 [Roseovarius sp. EC-SD190]